MSLYDTYMRYVEPFKGVTRFHRWAFLSCVAATLERRVWFNLGGLGKIHPNLYVVLCGGPGCGKTTVSNVATGFIKTYNKTLGPSNGGIRFGPDKVTPAALLLRLARTTKTIDGIPGSIKQSAMFLHSTELSTLIKDIGGGALTDDLLKLYDCDDVFEKETVKDHVMKISGPCLNLLADTTPSFLSGFLPREESGTGFTARILFATHLGPVEMDENVPDGDPILKTQIVTGLSRIHSMMGPFQVSASAERYWSNWWQIHREQMFKIHDGNFMRYFYARKPVHVRKVAMVLSACRDSCRILEVEDFKNAIEFIEDLEPEMAMSFGVQDYRRTWDFSKQIADLIPFDKEISKAELIGALWASGMGGRIDDLNANLSTLIEGGLIRIRVDGKHLFYRRLR